MAKSTYWCYLMLLSSARMYVVVVHPSVSLYIKHLQPSRSAVPFTLIFVQVLCFHSCISLPVIFLVAGTYK